MTKCAFENVIFLKSQPHDNGKIKWQKMLLFFGNVFSLRKIEEKLFLKELKDINKEFKCFSAIRSSGLWIGCKLNVTENFNLDTIMKACYANGLMILKANNNTIRIAPSLIIEDDLILKGLKILRQAIREQLR